MSEIDQNLLSELIAYNKELRSFWDKHIAVGRFRYEEKNRLLMKCDSYKYNEKGVQINGTSTFVRIPFKDWGEAVYAASKAMSDTSLFKALAKQINDVKQNDVGQHSLSRYTSRIFYLLSENKAKHLDEIAREFVLQMNNSDTHSWIHDAPLLGLAVEDKKILINRNIIIRKALPEDLIEIERPAEYMMPRSPYPSAFLSIRAIDKDHIQKSIYKTILLLQLFSGASVKLPWYKMETDSFFGGFLGKISTTIGISSIIETKFISRINTPSLKTFFRIFWGKIPPHYYGMATKEISPVSVAIERLSDSLFQSYLLEQRIANVVIGLEALFLAENQELSYKLSMRVSKFMCCLGYDGLITYEQVKKAYSLRSSYAHGDSKPDDKTNEETLNYISKCLRFGIIYFIRADKDSKKSKTAFLRLLDESLASPTQKKTLKKELLIIKNIKLI